jgi:hypothetical protein
VIFVIDNSIIDILLFFQLSQNFSLFDLFVSGSTSYRDVSDSYANDMIFVKFAVTATVILYVVI